MPAVPKYRVQVHATYCFALAQALLVAVLIGTAIGKSVEFSAPLDYVAHFTNWSWTLQIIFYALTVLAVTPPCVPFVSVVVGVCLLPLTAIVFSVLILVWILLSTDGTNFVGNLFSRIRAGFVMIGNDWFHLLPVNFLLLFYLAWGPLVFYSLYRVFTNDRVRTSESCFLVVLIYQLWGHLLLVGIYLLVLAALGTTVNEVYGTELNIGAGIAISAVVSFIVNGTILFVLARCYGLCVRRSASGEARLRRRVTTSEFEEWLEIERQRQ